MSWLKLSWSSSALVNFQIHVCCGLTLKASKVGRMDVERTDVRMEQNKIVPLKECI